MRIVHFESLESTNSEAEKPIYRHGDIIVADFQTNGRGQRGNRWASKKGANLMFSLVVEIPVAVYEQFYISTLASVSAMDALRELGLDCHIKWSNDLYVDDCKIGGILIEHHSMGEFLTRSIIGIGINVNQIEFDLNLPNPTSCVLQQVQTSPNEVLSQFCDAFQRRLPQPSDDLYNDFFDALWRKDGFYNYRDVEKGEIFSAKISYVDRQTGELTLLDDVGNLRKYWFKEVEFLL